MANTRDRGFEDYQIFTDGATTINTFIQALEEHRKSFRGYYGMIDSDAIFKGNIAESCFDAFDKLDSMLKTLSEEKFPRVEEALNDYSDSNKTSQKNAENNQLNTYVVLDNSGNIQVIQQGLVGNTTKDKIYNYLFGEGFNKAAISGILANMKRESELNPAAYNPNDLGAPSYGLVQWRAERYTNLQRWCQSNNLDYTSLEGQLKYLVHELNSNEYMMPQTLAALKNVPDTIEGAAQAADAFFNYYERGASWADHGTAAARQIYASFNS